MVHMVPTAVISITKIANELEGLRLWDAEYYRLLELAIAAVRCRVLERPMVGICASEQTA